MSYNWKILPHLCNHDHHTHARQSKMGSFWHRALPLVSPPSQLAYLFHLVLRYLWNYCKNKNESEYLFHDEVGVATWFDRCLVQDQGAWTDVVSTQQGPEIYSSSKCALPTHTSLFVPRFCLLSVTGSKLATATTPGLLWGGYCWRRPGEL